MIQPVRTGVATATLDPQRNYQLLIQAQGLCNARLDDENFEDDFHVCFLESLKGLAYSDNDGKPIEAMVRDQALEKCSGLVGRFLRNAALCAPDEPTQLDLVLSFNELTVLPFELLRIANPDGNAVHLGDPAAGSIVLTRRIRGSNIQESGPWPMKPRVLFAWAIAGSKHKPPHEKHYEALRDALGSYAPARTIPNYNEVLPATSSVITELKESTLDDIKQKCAEAQNTNAPYTHVHILAHGVAIQKDFGTVYGVRLSAKDGGFQDVSSEELSEALASMQPSCRAVTLAICDGGNEMALLYPRESLAHRLHDAGFPVVIGSQFPLTFDGSEIMASTFYRGEAQGQDVRQTLLEMRRALYERRDKTHDWAAVTPYVRLPDDYRQRLLLTSTGADLVALEAASDWMKTLIKLQTESFEKFEAVIDRVKAHAKDLEAKLSAVMEEPGLVQRQFLENEISGLIASSAKRRAEWWWDMTSQFPDRRDELINLSRVELVEARDWYERSAEDLNNHWAMMQAAAMQIITTGEVSDNLFLLLSRKSAEKTTARTDVGDDAYWAHGTLMECSMLDAHVDGSDGVPTAVHHFNKLMEMSAGDSFPRESTMKTLIRYRDWWTKENGFFADTDSDLSDMATEVIAQVD